MLIIVASKNIFRRELTSYTLLEAGHEIREIVDLEQLGQILGREAPTAIIADVSIAEAADVLRLVRVHTRAPVVWIGRQGRAYSQDAAVFPLDWPYQPTELLTSIEHLHQTALIAPPFPAPGVEQPRLHGA